jgi:hypothetical protein
MKTMSVSSISSADSDFTDAHLRILNGKGKHAQYQEEMKNEYIHVMD